MLVLALLAHSESYGYALVMRLRDAGLTDIATGTVYPVLTRLEREGSLSARLVPSSSGPARKYYAPTPAGLAAMAAQRTQWDRLSGVVDAAVPRPAGTDPAPSSTRTEES